MKNYHGLLPIILKFHLRVRLKCSNDWSEFEFDLARSKNNISENSFARYFWSSICLPGGLWSNACPAASKMNLHFAAGKNLRSTVLCFSGELAHRVDQIKRTQPDHACSWFLDLCGFCHRGRNHFFYIYFCFVYKKNDFGPCGFCKNPMGHDSHSSHSLSSRIWANAHINTRSLWLFSSWVFCLVICWYRVLVYYRTSIFLSIA